MAAHVSSIIDTYNPNELEMGSRGPGSNPGCRTKRGR